MAFIVTKICKSMNLLHGIESACKKMPSWSNQIITIHPISSKSLWLSVGYYYIPFSMTIHLGKDKKIEDEPRPWFVSLQNN